MTTQLPPVILLHGCGGTPGATFIDHGWTDRLGRTGRTVEAMFLPGHGPDAQSHDPLDYADLAASMLQRLPSGPIDLIGFSLGAKVALAIAVRAPERLRRLVIAGIGDNLFQPEAVGDAAAVALEHGMSEDTPPAVCAFMRTWQPDINDGLAVAAVLRRPPNPVLHADQLHDVQVPVLLINGANDAVCMLADRLLAALNPRQHLIVRNAGHFDLTSKDETREAAAQFLEDGSHD